jgi:AcrR family transcriptional regulator
VSTEKKILNTARKLFNERGTANVTVRHIAAEMKISHGNLCYHYPSTGAIIRALYEELVEQFNKAISSIAANGKMLDYVQQVSRGIAEQMYDYRFFFLDFVDIIRSDEWIRKHYRQLMEERKKQFRSIFAFMVSEGLLQPEKIPGQYEQLTELQFLSGDFWLSRAQIMGIRGKEKQVDFFMQMQLVPIIGMLTEKGLKALKG